MSLAKFPIFVLAALGLQLPAKGIFGRVVDASTGNPIAGAVVSLTTERKGSEALGESTLSDDTGRFAFRGRELGQDHILAALKTGYQDGRYGRGTGGATDANGDIIVRMAKWGSITGVVVDEAGEPLVGVPVRAVSEIHLGGNSSFAAGPIASTDDRGVYRIPRLPAGAYLIQVPSVKWAVSGAAANALTQAAAGPAGQRAASASGPAVILGDSRLVLSPYPVPPPQVAGERRRSYGATFAPASTTVASAGRYRLAVGEDLAGVDISVYPRPSFRITGSVVGRSDWIDGAIARLVRVGEESLGIGSEEATAVVGSGGRFEFLDVLPGAYRISVREAVSEVIRGAPAAISLPTPPGWAQGATAVAPLTAAPPGTSLATRTKRGKDDFFGVESVVVTDSDQEGLNVVLHESLVVRGRVVMGEESGPPVVPLFEPASGRVDFAPIPLPRIADPDGTFQVSGLLPIAYRLRLPRVAGWVVVAVEVDGLRSQGDGIDLSAGQPRDLVVFAARVRSGVRGDVVDASGRKITKGVVIVFPQSQSDWKDFGFSPVGMALAPVVQGEFEFAGIPPGSYWLAWADDLPEDWRHAGFLSTVVRGATGVEVKADQIRRATVRLSK